MKENKVFGLVINWYAECSLYPTTPISKKVAESRGGPWRGVRRFDWRARDVIEPIDSRLRILT